MNVPLVFGTAHGYRLYFADIHAQHLISGTLLCFWERRQAKVLRPELMQTINNHSRPVCRFRVDRSERVVRYPNDGHAGADTGLGSLSTDSDEYSKYAARRERYD